MIRHYEFRNKRLLETVSAGDVLVAINPESGEKQYLLEEYELDEHTLLSSLDPNELSRLEIEGDHNALILKVPKNYSAEDDYEFKVFSIGLFLFKKSLIIIMSEENNLFDPKLTAKINSPNDLLLKIIYGIIFHFLRHLKVISMITEELEEKISKAMENKYLLCLFTLEKSLVYYLNAINTNSVLIEKIRHNASRLHLGADDLELLDEIIIENTQCFKQAEIYSNILASMMDARASIVNNNLNVLMKRLNIITISLMVPTLVVSVFSMNVKIPMQNFPWAFAVIISISLLAMSLFLSLWKFFNKS
ncbi:MAG TPA: divalent metal ion transporter [Spirochaetia bacterium]|nr:divalent metal ion transporter [Spirochaetia bacterium]